jgi:ammonium transporter, Amt family
MQATLDSVWVLFAAFLVFFMHAGFALLESGFCRKKNVVTILLKNFGVISLSSIVFYAVGYGVMFGEGNSFIGLSSFAPSATDPGVETLPLYVFLFFQLVFAATAATIVSGAVAERARLLTFFVFVGLAAALVYPIVGHWVWGGGFLEAWGFHDFAGSTVVHATGGAMALAGTLALGPRLGRFGKDGSSRAMPAHSFPLAALGVFVLWLGWFGFNGGSTLAADPALIAPVILVTNLAAGAGFLAALAYTKLRTGMLDLSMGLNGVLGGLVGITAGADVLSPMAGLVIGGAAGILVVEGVFWLDRRRIDDPVGAIPVHLFAGAFGTIAVGIASVDGGLLHGGGFALLIAQIGGTAAGAGFAFAMAALLWFGMKLAVPGGIRVSAAHEQEGLDISECGVEAYSDEPRGLSPAPAAPALPPAHQKVEA